VYNGGMTLDQNKNNISFNVLNESNATGPHADATGDPQKCLNVGLCPREARQVRVAGCKIQQAFPAFDTITNGRRRPPAPPWFGCAVTVSSAADRRRPLPRLSRRAVAFDSDVASGATRRMHDT
jgi:hypothetical protein